MLCTLIIFPLFLNLCHTVFKNIILITQPHIAHEEIKSSVHNTAEKLKGMQQDSYTQLMSLNIQTVTTQFKHHTRKLSFRLFRKTENKQTTTNL